MVIADNWDVAHLFSYMSDKNTFTHLGGLNWNPSSKKPKPAQNEIVRLYKQDNMAAWFDGKDAKGKTIDSHSAKINGGSWEKVFQVKDPKT